MTLFDVARLSEPPVPPVPVRPATMPGFWGFFRAMRANPLTAWPETAYREPFIHMPGVGFRPSLTLVTEPSMVKRMFLDQVSLYEKGEIVRRRLKPFLGDGILIADETNWRPQRRIVAPMFQHRNVLAMAPAMAGAAEDAVRQMAAEDGAFDLGEAMLGLAYEVIARTAFSADAVSDPPAFSRAIAAYFHSLGRLDLATYLQLPEWMPTLGRCQARAPLALFRREIGGIIARRAAALVRQGLDGVPDDLLTRLMTERDPQTGLPLTDALIYDNALVFLAAGHETTAGLLTWTLFLLGNHPDWEARVAAELASARATDGTVSLESAPLTRAVLDETMRLYPPVPFIPRMTKAPDRLGPLDLKKGSVVFAAPFVSHRHHAHWERPDAFDPDRFLTGRDPDRHVFFPFGLGPRICIGARFAMQEAVIALAALLPEHRVELTAPERVMPRANITLKPAAPVVARLLPRALRPRADRNASRYTPPPAP